MKKSIILIGVFLFVTMSVWAKQNPKYNPRTEPQIKLPFAPAGYTISQAEKDCTNRGSSCEFTHGCSQNGYTWVRCQCVDVSKSFFMYID